MIVGDTVVLRILFQLLHIVLLHCSRDPSLSLPLLFLIHTNLIVSTTILPLTISLFFSRCCLLCCCHVDQMIVVVVIIVIVVIIIILIKWLRRRNIGVIRRFAEASLPLLAIESSLFKSTAAVDVAAALREERRCRVHVVRRVNVLSLSPSFLSYSSSSSFAPLLLNGRRFFGIGLLIVLSLFLYYYIVVRTIFDTVACYEHIA